MLTKYLTVEADLKVSVWEHNDTFPPDATYIGEFVHEEALDPFGMVLRPKLLEFALKRLRELAVDPETVNKTSVELVKAYGDNFVQATEVVEPAPPVPEENIEPTQEPEQVDEIPEDLVENQPADELKEELPVKQSAQGTKKKKS